MENIKIAVASNGTTTLATAGKYCDRNVDVEVNVPKDFKTVELGVWENREYLAADYGVDGFHKVIGLVPTDANLTSLYANENRNYSASEYGVDGFSDVWVDVNTGAVVESINITANGTYIPPTGIDGYNWIEVKVPPQDAVLLELPIFENREYSASEYGVDGFSKVIANVMPRVAELGIWENGEYLAENYGIDGFSRVTVNVAGGDLPNGEEVKW